MKKLTKQEKKAIQELSKQLPTEIEGASIVVKGQEIIDDETNHFETLDEIKGDIDPDKFYKVKGHNLYYVKHFRRLKKAYIKHGIKGINHYLRKYGLQIDLEKSFGFR